MDPMSCASGESPQAEQTNDEPAPKPQEQRKEPKKPVEDGLDIENGEMNGNAIWEQEAADKAELILEGGYARLSDVQLRQRAGRPPQKIRIKVNTELSYRIKIETT
jgi:hypothetical protein